MTRGMLSMLCLAVCLTSVVGCKTTDRTDETIAMKRAHLPDSWVYLSPSSSKVRALPSGLRTRLSVLRDDLVREQQSQYFSYYGTYPPETLSRIENMNRACNEAYMVSDHIIASDLTPELRTISETDPDLWWNDQVIYDVQSRELMDDWQSFWLMKSPSTLSPYPIMDLTQP